MSKTTTQRVLVAVLALLCTSSCSSARSGLVFDITTTSPAPLTTSTTAPSEIVQSVVPKASALVDHIVDDFISTYLLRTECGRTPRQCPVQQMTIAGSPLSVALTNTMRERVTGNLATRTDAGKLRVRIESVEIIDQSHADVHTCIFDSVVLFDSGQFDSTADDIVFDDSIISARMVWKVQLDLGTWKWHSTETTQRKIGADLCGFSS